MKTTIDIVHDGPFCSDVSEFVSLNFYKDHKKECLEDFFHFHKGVRHHKCKLTFYMLFMYHSRVFNDVWPVRYGMEATFKLNDSSSHITSLLVTFRSSIIQRDFLTLHKTNEGERGHIEIRTQSFRGFRNRLEKEVLACYPSK